MIAEPHYSALKAGLSGYSGAHWLIGWLQGEADAFSVALRGEAETLSRIQSALALYTETADARRAAKMESNSA